jgi:hypothetical protein
MTRGTYDGYSSGSESSDDRFGYRRNKTYKEDNDMFFENASNEDEHGPWRTHKSRKPETRKMLHSFMGTQSIKRRVLAQEKLDFSADSIIQDTALYRCRHDQPRSLSMLVTVPDMYEFVLHLIDDSNCAIADLLDYLKGMDQAETGRGEDRILLDAVLSKIFDTERIRHREQLRKEGSMVAAPRYACDGDRLVPALMACHELEIDFLSMKAVRCLRGAPVSVLAKLLKLCPSFPLSLIEDE